MGMEQFDQVPHQKNVGVVGYTELNDRPPAPGGNRLFYPPEPETAVRPQTRAGPGGSE